MPLFLRVFWLSTCASPAKWTSSSSWSFRRGSACGRAGRRCAPWARSRLSSRRPCGRARRRGRRRRHPPPSRSARRSSRPSTVWWAGSARRGRRAHWRARRTRVACPAATGPGRCLQHAKRVQLTHSSSLSTTRTCILHASFAHLCAALFAPRHARRFAALLGHCTEDAMGFFWTLRKIFLWEKLRKLCMKCLNDETLAVWKLHSF